MFSRVALVWVRLKRGCSHAGALVTVAAVLLASGIQHQCTLPHTLQQHLGHLHYAYTVGMLYLHVASQYHHPQLTHDLNVSSGPMHESPVDFHLVATP
jgi:hypothetical protein